MNNYDVIIVGAGAAGGIVAGVLAEAGKRVLLLERGRKFDYDQVSRDHLRNHRLSLYGHNTGPELDGNPRVFVDPAGNEHRVRPHEPNYHNNAMCVGGGTRIYGAQAWRFMPQDFRMATTYGVPHGSSLADWPIGYNDLAPYYEKAEWEIGVSGDDAGSVVPRKNKYPMPPVPDTLRRMALNAGARELGWKTTAVPLLINTTRFNGREACIKCNTCIGFACPNESKNGSHNTMIPRALASGNCELITEAQAEKIDIDANGNVIGVSYFTASNGSIQRQSVRARITIVSSGAIESARLLLNSSAQYHPAGLGNRYNLVGRNLQGHYYPGALALMPENMYDGMGPGVSIATCKFNHGNPGIVGGGMLADEFIKLPIIFWRMALPPDIPRWGQANKDFMRRNYTRVIHVQGPVQDIPNPESRVSIDKTVRDAFGIPVARLSGTAHPETLKTAEFMRDRAVEWLKASGAEKIWTIPMGLHLSAHQHQAGTCRMGDDPKVSVTDRWGRVHGHDNLFVIDGSLHVTNGGFNPVLTIMALAFRCAEHIAKTM